MNERLEKIKNHVKKHKVAYSCVATGVVVTGITTLIVRGRYVSLGNAGLNGSNTADSSVTMRPFIFNLMAKQSGNVITTIEREGRGHPGYVTRCLETLVDYTSQADAARWAGVSPGVMSKHIAGLLPNAGGYHFEHVPA